MALGNWTTPPTPDGWRSRPIADVVGFPSGQVDPRFEPYRSMVLVAPDHIESGSGMLIAKVSAANQGAISGKYLFSPGDTLYSKIRPYLRKAVLADFGGLTSADMYPLRPTPEVEPRFLLAILLGEHFSRFAQIVSMRSGFPKINRDEFAEYTVALPSRAEQRRIAEILDALDETIRKTEQLIAKLKQVKQGLLHDLLTRGIDENGELRDPARHPGQFKDSPLGLVPLEWEVTSIAGLCVSVIDCPHSTPIFTTDGPLVARTSNIKAGWFDGNGASRVSEGEYARRIARLEPRPGDVVFTREAPVGEAFVIPDGMRICLGQRVMLLRPNPRRLDPHYLVAQVYSGAVARRIDLLTGGTTNPHLNVADIKDFQIPAPPVHEQYRIASALGDHDRWLDDEAISVGKLRLIKVGLTEDLLTGRVRVPMGARKS